MEKTKTHLLYVPFTGLGRIDRGDKWLKNRIKIFKAYVLQALCNQSNLHFTLWISWRPEDINNPIVADFYRHLNQVRAMSPVFTYDGLCFYDDKYPDAEARERLFNNLKNTLPHLKTHVDHADEVLVTIQPSDDMFLSFAVETIQNTDFGDAKAIGWEKGYLINFATKEIAEYNPDTIAPFSTIKYDKETFLDPQKHFDHIGPYKSHEYVKDLGFKALEGRGYVVGTHTANISTTWNIPYKGRTLTKDEQDSVLLQTGTYFTEPIVMPQNTKLFLRKIFNILPFRGIIKALYYRFNLHKHL